MAKRVRKTPSKRSRNPGSKPNTLESITGDDALAILKVLAARDRRLAEEIEAVAKERFSSIEMQAVAADVMMQRFSVALVPLREKIHDIGRTSLPSRFIGSTQLMRAISGGARV